MRRLGLVVAAGIALLFSQHAQAQEEAVCEHAKLNTGDASTLEAGGWEMEFGFGLTCSSRVFTDHGGTGTDRRGRLRERDYGIGLTYGLTGNLDVGLAAGGANVHDREADDHTVHGWGDLELGAKWRFYQDEERRLEVAYVPAFTVPTGNADVTDGFVNLFNGIAVSKDWTSRLTSNFDLGYNVAVGGAREDYRGTLSADAALGYHITEWLQPEIELNYGHDFNRGNDADLLAVTVGGIFCLSDHLRVGLGVQQGLAGRNADKAMTFLAALTFAR